MSRMEDKLVMMQVWVFYRQKEFVKRRAKELGYASVSEMFRHIIDHMRGEAPKQLIVRCPECGNPLVQLRWRGKMLKCPACKTYYYLKSEKEG